MAMTKSSETPVLVGHPFAPIGRGEDVRCSFRAFQAAGQTLPIRDIYSIESQADSDLEQEIGGHLVHELSPSINLFHLNGDEVQQALNHVAKELPAVAHNVVYPQWELSVYPREWKGEINRFDEIWAPSRFVFDCLAQATSKPIFHMPLPVQVQLISFLGRRYFGLPESSYLFLFYFDFRSYVDRKNPFAVINAFERVCSARPSMDMRLVLKLNRGITQQSESDFQRFLAEITQSRYQDRIITIDKVLTDNEIKNLVRCCNCFVSLHRSEGLGRGMAEAMYLGKPVVATGYSGNLDFMNHENSCLVRYDLVEVRKGAYPHHKGQVWAEADIEHAVHHMLKLVDDRNYGRELGKMASRHIRAHFSYRAAGLRYSKRLRAISTAEVRQPDV